MPIVSSGQTLSVTSAQTVSGYVVQSGGVMDIYSAGTALATTFSGGDGTVFEGGFISGAIVEGGTRIATSGGIFIVGGELDISGGTIVATASATTINNGGTVRVSSGGAAIGTTVNAGGWLINDGGSTDNATVNSGGTEFLEGIGTDTTGTVLSGGVLQVEAFGNTSATSTVVSAGGVLQNFGTTIGTIVRSGGEEIDGPVADFATGTYVDIGGRQIVSGGRGAVNTQIAGGEQDVYARTSGTVIGNVVGLEDVFSGGTSADTTIAGGTLRLEAGAVTSGSITFNTAGSRMVVAGTNTPGAVISGFVAGDSMDFSDLAFDSNYTVQVVKPTNTLEWLEFGTAYTLSLDPSQDFTGEYFHLSNDGVGFGGTLITLGQKHQAGGSDELGNGISDILFRSDASGDLGFYQISSGSFAGWHDIAASSTAYTAVGQGDFTRDATSDILFRNNATGDYGYYQISNGALQSWHHLGASSTAYSVVGIGDFDGDGVSDVLFRNNATGDIGYQTRFLGGWHDIGPSNTAYSVVGVGDFNGDGVSDVLFRNNATGDTGFNQLSSTGSLQGWHSVGPSSTAYAVVGIGDFNGDGVSDILFRNNSTGDVGFYQMNRSGTLQGWHSIGPSSTAYSVVGVGDYFASGTSDILFRNAATGDTGFYQITNGAFAGWHDIGPSATSYHVVT